MPECRPKTKATPDQVPEDVLNIKGYHSCFDSSKIRKGYSGVAIYSKEKPEKIEYGLGKDHMDLEGRLLTVYFKDFIFMNCYWPNGGKSEEHFQYKLNYSVDISVNQYDVSNNLTYSTFFQLFDIQISVFTNIYFSLEKLVNSLPTILLFGIIVTIFS